MLVPVWLPLVRSVVTSNRVSNEVFHEELIMRTLLSILALFSASLPAFGIDPITPVPEPESLSLLGVAAAAMLVALRRKK